MSIKLRFAMNLLLLFTSIPVMAATPECEVYTIDVKAQKKYFSDASHSWGNEELKKIEEETVKVLGKFSPNVGEEENTLAYFAIPKSKLWVSVRTYFTDESLPPTSILLGFSVAPRKVKDPLLHPSMVEAETSIANEAWSVRVKKQITLNGTLYLLGLQCSEK